MNSTIPCNCLGCLEVDESRDVIGNGCIFFRVGELNCPCVRKGEKGSDLPWLGEGRSFFKTREKGGLLTDFRANPPHSSTLSFAPTLVDAHTRIPWKRGDGGRGKMLAFLEIRLLRLLITVCFAVTLCRISIYIRCNIDRSSLWRILTNCSLSPVLSQVVDTYNMHRIPWLTKATIHTDRYDLLSHMILTTLSFEKSSSGNCINCILQLMNMDTVTYFPSHF